MFFDRQGVEMIAIGLRSGIGILKKAETLLSAKEEARILPVNYQEKAMKKKTTLDLDKSKNSSSDSILEDKVTFIGLLSTPTRLIFGSKAGYLTLYNLSQKDEEPVSFPMQAANMQRIVQVMELPSQVKEAKKHIYYVLQ